MNWFQHTPEEVLKQLDTDPKRGLDAEKLAQRQHTFGPNRLTQTQNASAVQLFVKQLKNPLLVVLTFGAVLSLYTGHTIDALVISLIIFLNAFITFFQELKAQKSIDALKNMAAPTCRVRRNDDWHEMSATELVPGDIIQLQTGDIVPADARLLSVTHLEVDEAALTGESEQIAKQVDAIDAQAPSLGDQTNMVFMSTSVNHGHAQAVVTATGMHTQVGKIAHLMQTTDNRLTPLQNRIAKLAHTLIWAALVIVSIIIGIGLLKGLDPDGMINTSISLAVAAIPEGLVTIVTIVLTLGAKQMMHNNALTKQLASVETLGSTSVICSDKTGTLTQNKMQTVRLWAAGEYYRVTGQGYEPYGDFLDAQDQVQPPQHHIHLYRMLEMSVLCNDATLTTENGLPQIQGVPTEAALLVAAAKAGLDKGRLEHTYQRLQSHPFDPNRKMMSVIVRDPDGNHLLIVKGAPDVVLKHSEVIEYAGQHRDLVSNPNLIDEVIHELGSQALRTLAIAYRPLQPEEVNLPLEALENRLIILGIHGIIDPPRPEATQAVQECHSAGIRVVMITGDHAITAKAIARQMDIIDADDERVMTGTELNQISDEQLRQLAPKTTVFARVTPEHKLRIVKALQANGEVVAMTGDGVNDSPALRKADIGIAMGVTGTGVAKESADLILLDDNFATIVHAVREGRRIYDNILKFIRQDLTTNVAETSAILFAFLLISGDPLLTLAPLMILWINLISDGIPSLALGVDQAEGDVMKRKPRAGNGGFFAGHLGTRILTRGFMMGGVTFAMFMYALNQNLSLEYAQTLAFMTMIFGQLMHVFDARTMTTLYRRNPLNNHLLLWAVFGSGTLSLLMVYTPIGHLALGTTPLEPQHLLMTFFIATLPTFILSAIKEGTGVKWL